MRGLIALQKHCVQNLSSAFPVLRSFGSACASSRRFFSAMPNKAVPLVKQPPGQIAQRYPTMRWNPMTRPFTNVTVL
jgi:hypothetical protein